MSKTIYHPSAADLPQGFKYPEPYLDFINQDTMPNLNPWFFMCFYEEDIEDGLEILNEQYPERCLVPFAKCNYNDDVACFEPEEGQDLPAIFIIHSFTEPGYEEVDSMDTFEEWLEFTKEEARRYQLSKYGAIDASLKE